MTSGQDEAGAKHCGLRCVICGLRDVLCGMRLMCCSLEQRVAHRTKKSVYEGWASGDGGDRLSVESTQAIRLRRGGRCHDVDMGVGCCGVHVAPVVEG